MTRRRVLLALLPLALAAAVGSIFLARRPPITAPTGVNEDPRLAYTGPFRNVHPDVGYVAESRCAECHPTEARDFAAHPMGNSLRLTENRTPPVGPAQNVPFAALGLRFDVTLQGGELHHRGTRLGEDGRPAGALDWTARYAIGSGKRGFSFLADRDGRLVMTPVSWYSEKGIWDLSPGFEMQLMTGRAVQPECLFCHANRVRHRAGTLNAYEGPIFDGHAIGCQRCHGPGALHAAARERGEAVPGPVDHAIVNPKHLDNALRNAVCEQCHLVGETRVVRRGRDAYDYRPGLGLADFRSSFVSAAETGGSRRAVDHVEQMYESRCFQKSTETGGLACTSCHDPHKRPAPEQRVAHYRERCLHCHESRGCTEPVAERRRRSANDSCIDCHMPRYATADIPHTASTDHRIPRRPGASVPLITRPSAARWPLRSFHVGDLPKTAEDERDLAIAVADQAQLGNARCGQALPRVTPLLAAAVRRDPDDHVAGEAYGHALGLQNLLGPSLAAFEAVLERAPDRELARVGAAVGAVGLGRTEAALAHWRAAVALNPWSTEYRARLTRVLLAARGWAEAETAAAEWTRVNPFDAEARAARLEALLALARRDDARTEWSAIEALAPPNLRELRLRWSDRLK